MARQSGGIRAVPRILYCLFFLIWVIVSAIAYGFCCFITGIFSKTLAQIIGSAWNRHLLRLARITIQVKGRERLKSKTCYVFFSNHSSALDIPILYTAINIPIVFIAKKELFWIPIMGWGMKGMGHIVLDRSNPRKARVALNLAVRRLKKSNFSLVLFPEGTRSVDGKLGEFKQGSFALALEARVSVVPVAIQKANELLPKKAIMVRSGTVFVTIGDPIDPKGMDKSELCARVRSEIEKVICAGK
jgi:1-acyl-sn-glycerol-3-phosphate acyltransferase